MASNEKELVLHPAAAIFRTVILGDINAENKRFMDDVARLQPLLDHIQKVEVIGATNDAPITVNPVHRGGNVINMASPPEMKVISSAQLSHGAIVDDGDGEKLAIPIVSSHDLLLSNLNFFGGVGVRMADETLGHFPRTIKSSISSNIADSIIVSIIDEDQTVYLSIFISESVYICGKVNGLSNNEIIKFKEESGNSYHISQYLSSETDISSSPTFTPTSIGMDLTPSLRETLHMIGKATSSSENGSQLEKSLQSLTVAALGDDEHKKLLEENYTLKLQREALMNIREKIMRVDISHDDGTMSFSLEGGERRTDEEGNSSWVVRLADKENSTMTVDSIKHSAIFLSGIQLNKPGDLHRYASEAALIEAENIPILGIQIPFTYGVKVCAHFNWNALNDDETASVTEDFFGGLRVAMLGRLTRGIGGEPVPAFPPTFKMTLTEVMFNTSIVGPVLEMVGSGDKLFLNFDDAGSD